MGDRRLDHGREIRPVDERGEIVEEDWDLLRRRRDELGVERTVQSAADPVLLRPDPPRDVVVDPSQERSVDVGDVRDGERPILRPDRDGGLHCPDIACHGPGGPAGGCRVEQGAGEAALRQLEALDPRRGHAFSPKEEGPDRLESAEGGAAIEQPDLGFGQADEQRRLARKADREARDRVGDVRLVCEGGPASSAAVGVRVALPTESDCAGHRWIPRPEYQGW